MVFFIPLFQMFVLHKVSKSVNFLSDKRIYNAKKTFFNSEVKIEIKTNTTTVLKSELKYSSMSEGNSCVYSSAKPRGITLKIIQ